MIYSPQRDFGMDLNPLLQLGSPGGKTTEKKDA